MYFKELNKSADGDGRSRERQILAEHILEEKPGLFPNCALKMQNIGGCLKQNFFF